VELFRKVEIDWLGKKWYFLSFSLLFSVAGVLSMLFWHHIPRGVDFKGGTLVYVKFDQTPDTDKVRQATARGGIAGALIQRFGSTADDEVIVSLPEAQTSENSLDAGRTAIVAALAKHYSAAGAAAGDKLDLDNAGAGVITELLVQKDPEHLGLAGQAHYATQGAAIADFRDNQHGGLMPSVDALNGVADAAVVSELKQDAYLSGFHIFNTEVVGPQVGKALRNQAFWATIYSLAGMLVYLWFRFELIYGLAAVVAVFHDTLITVGFFSLFNKEITLTVIAAILTLIGYSMNDTVVVFDRIRENLRMNRREALADVVNRSINQTLSRTVLSSGLTFLTVLALYLFGGEVLKGFSFALVIGILIGTYSSIAVAAPMLVAYQQWRAKHGKAAVLPAGKKARV
jgi:preprotein translocase subunit SecF